MTDDPTIKTAVLLRREWWSATEVPPPPDDQPPGDTWLRVALLVEQMIAEARAEGLHEGQQGKHQR